VMSGSPRRSPWLLIIGFTVWMLAFIVLYAAHALGCWFGLHQMAVGPVSLHRVVLVALFGLVLLVHALLVLRIRRSLSVVQSAEGQGRGSSRGVGSPGAVLSPARQGEASFAAGADSVGAGRSEETGRAAEFLLQAGLLAALAALGAALFGFAPVLGLTPCA
jgi:hypothetical protein